MTAADGQDEGLRERMEALANDLDRMFRSAGEDEPRGSRTREFALSTGMGYRRASLRIRDVLAGGDGSLYYGALPWLRPAASNRTGAGEQQRERVAVELGRHHNNWGPRDDDQPDVWFSWCECGWVDAVLNSARWSGRYRLHVADELLALLSGDA